MDDPHDLQRFIAAQAPVFGAVTAELEVEQKRVHCVWFVFPPMAGLGSSPMARRRAIRSLDEARAYLAHPVLGGRLRRCIDLVLAAEGRDITPIVGSPDDAKVRSCMTLFGRAAPREARYLTMCMHNQSFTRLTSAFSRRVESHAYAVDSTASLIECITNPSGCTGRCESRPRCRLERRTGCGTCSTSWRW